MAFPSWKRSGTRLALLAMSICIAFALQRSFSINGGENWSFEVPTEASPVEFTPPPMLPRRNADNATATTESPVAATNEVELELEPKDPEGVPTVVLAPPVGAAKEEDALPTLRRLPPTQLLELLTNNNNIGTNAGDTTQLNRTKIVGFINEAYVQVAMRWYDRLTALGYTEQVIIATDNVTSYIFETDHPYYRVEASYRPTLPELYWSEPYTSKMRKGVELIFAHRWVYLLEQLKAGYHVLITDVDNIFSKYHPMSALELSEYDVFHALETKHPGDVFDAIGFVVCGGMGWFRSSPTTIQFVQTMVDRCGILCDDQVILNKLLAFDMEMVWNLTDWHKSIRTNNTEDRLNGLLKESFTGVSNKTGHKVMIWDQEFAYRGDNNPDVCPADNWVSMPFVVFRSRKRGGAAKYKSFDLWDSTCPNDYSNMPEEKKHSHSDSQQQLQQQKQDTPTDDVSQLESQQQQQQQLDIQTDKVSQLHRTKIVGFINEAYMHVSMRWYDRLTALGYTEQVIIATDNATSYIFEHDYAHYRVEASYRPTLPLEYESLSKSQKRRKEIELIFAHRWVYLLQQLKAGYHVLITDVDNIFSKFYPMSALELSDYDVFHALETKHPGDVFDAIGFVVCGGMGWFRSSPATIQFVQTMVDRCGILCDDQVVLNKLLAFDMDMVWNLTDWHKSIRTNNTEDRLNGLLKESFTGVSNKTGHKVMIWDQEFAYRGDNNPDVCPADNWVSMPFVIFKGRRNGGAAKYKSFDLWDSTCPNDYSNMSEETKNANKADMLQDTLAGDASQVNRTKIVGFINEAYVQVGTRWFDRLTSLGYTEHIIIATDKNASLILENNFPQYRMEASYRPPLPDRWQNAHFRKKARKEIEGLFAHRWVYLLEQLKAGYHVLLTDVDNIFSKYHPMSAMELSEFDVFHALETKYPEDVYNVTGFVVCGGMAWFRSSPTTIDFVERIVDRCGVVCDDQIILNTILAFELGMEWNLTEWHRSLRTVNKKDHRLDDVMIKGFTGVSNQTGHKVMIWDRDFAYRGANDPDECPLNNWVSMPMVVIRGRWEAASAKNKSYDIWDSYCPNQFSTMTTNLKGENGQQARPHSITIGGNVQGPSGPSHSTRAGDLMQLNRTKIVGFINAAYTQVGVRWFERLTALGYTEHVIIATDNETSWVFETQFPQYRVEASYRPPLPERYQKTRHHSKKMRREIELLFAHRWVYLLEQLKAGYHVLLTDVDNIFSKYHPMSAMELSAYDVFHALETQHPTHVFNATGFVVCGGMAWFRASPSTIQFVQFMVDRCGEVCDDQVVLNSILAFDMGMDWNLTTGHKSFRTTNVKDSRLDGLLINGFTGVSNKTGHKVMIWDRDFAYRGENDPDICPVDNWVSMPLVVSRGRWEAASAKFNSYDIWDNFCPNKYSIMTATAKIEAFKKSGLLKYTKGGDITQLNRTKIVGFVNEAYSHVGMLWYDRLAELGYTEHVIIATDNLTAWAIATKNPQYRVETSDHPPLPMRYWKSGYARRTRKQFQLLLAQRWVYLLEQLKAGYHVLVTDVENIFSKYYPMSAMELSEYDAFHALETKNPSDVFQLLGFTICAGMGWFRSSPSTIQLIQHMVDKCGELCDDQVTLNSIVAIEMPMEWNLTGWHRTFRSSNDMNANLDGLLIKSFTGISERTAHKVMVWDREFAYRGENAPDVCPSNNWVSMPLLAGSDRLQAVSAKYQSFGIWDTNCPNEYSNMPAIEKVHNVGKSRRLQDTKGGDMAQLNRTKIVGFINVGYIQVGMRWYDRLTALGYTEHSIIATDNETSWAFETQYPHYRVEASYRPTLPEKFWSEPYSTKMRKEVELIFAHRWVYLLKQLQAGYHVLITDVDNIFSTYHAMSNMELSEYDVFHALETKYPTKVFEALGFTFCGGMGWFRSSPSTIQLIQQMVDQCGDVCDDQVMLNYIMAFEMSMEWNVTAWHRSFRTSHTEARLDGLLVKGFTGVSKKTGHKVMVWDRDFAYRGDNDPKVCPLNNWVSMPFVDSRGRWEAASAKFNSYDIWDNFCPNAYSNKTAAAKN